MKYESKVFHFKNHIIDIPDGSIIVKYFHERGSKSMWSTIPECEILVALIPLKEE